MKKQTSKDKFWVDESGNSIPFSRITPLEKKKERVSFSILQNAKFASLQLAELKKMIAESCSEIFLEHMTESNVETEKISKGNYTWYNFDRSIKIVVKINDRIEFDDLTLRAAKEKLDEFLGRNVNSANEAVKQMILDAFETRGGKVDPKKVLSLVRYKNKINDVLFTEAIELLESSIRKPSSKTYYQVFEINDEGGYDLVVLDFAAL